MVKFQKNTILGITVLAMLASAPMSVTYSFAEGQDKIEQEFSKPAKGHERIQKSLLTEVVVEGKLEVKRYGLPDNISHKDIGRILTLPQETTSWAFVDNKVYQSGIVLFDGKAVRLGENQWEIKPFNQNSIQSASQENLHESSPYELEELFYKVVFSGKITEAGSDYSGFGVSTSLKGMDSGHCLKVMKSCEFTKNASSSNPDRTLQNYYWVG